jgi:SAM-dependent methyltransferase
LRWPAARWIWRRIERAPRFGDDADRSVQRKYDLQADDYLRMRSSNLTDEQIAALRVHAEPPARVLVAGCGAAGEAIHFARLGYRVTGFDVLPSMVAAARRAVAEAGVEADILEASLDDFDPRGERFGAIYFTPVLYSFLAGRDRRIAVLRRLAGSLEPDGALLLSAAHPRDAVRRAQVAVAWARRRLRGDRAVERGDWYTMYLAADGSVGTSFLHLFRPGQVEAELLAAGYAGIRRLGAHYLAMLSR